MPPASSQDNCSSEYRAALEEEPKKTEKQENEWTEIVEAASVIEAAGFRFIGERGSIRPDGSVSRSRYWELTR